jgi:ABC-type dipeptide/oligopeptide/nickel transport system permease component
MKYRNYVAKRLFLLIPIFFGITFVTFVLTYEISDPIAHYIGADSKEISKQQKDRYREQLGLNKPLIDRYFLLHKNPSLCINLCSKCLIIINLSNLELGTPGN